MPSNQAKDTFPGSFSPQIAMNLERNSARSFACELMKPMERSGVALFLESSPATKPELDFTGPKNKTGGAADLGSSNFDRDKIQ
jgi:hypothetical protein